MKHLIAASLVPFALLAAGATAHADAPTPRLDLRVADGDDDTAGSAAVAAAPVAPPAIIGPRSPGAARAMSIGVTLGGVALVAGGAWLMDATADLDTPGGAETPLWFYGTTALGGLAMIAGPSAGHAYAGEWGHALLFTGLRTGALLLAATGLAETDCAESCSGLGDGAALALGLGGLAASVGLAVYDIWDSARAARRYNTRVLAEAGLTASVVPTYDPHRRAGGLALAGSF